MPLKVCLVGAGHMGGIHAQKLSRMKGVTLTCIVDADRSHAEALGQKCGVGWSEHYEKVLSGGVDGVVIASTTETHFAVARDFLKNGVHVFVEKPITATPDEATELITLARKNGLVLQVGHLERFSPPFRKARRTLRAPLSIEAHRISAFTGRSTDIDVIHDLMIHDIDLVLSLETSPVKRVTARGASVFTKKIDVANARIEFEDGGVATLSASRASGTKERVFKIVEGGKFFLLDLGLGRMISFERTPDGQRRTSAFKATRPDPVGDELKAFVRAIKGEKEDIVDGEAGLRALLLANRISAEIEAGLSGGKKSAIE
jgi:predicted dehydrogenase